MEYLVLKSTNIDELVRMVNERVGRYWQPHGDLVTFNGADNRGNPILYFLQPMIRPKVTLAQENSQT